jgi:integrase
LLTIWWGAISRLNPRESSSDPTTHPVLEAVTLTARKKFDGRSRAMRPPCSSPPASKAPDERLEALLMACAGKDFESRRDTAIVRAFLDTGARLSELAGLRMEDIDFSYDVLVVVGKAGGHARARSAARA